MSNSEMMILGVFDILAYLILLQGILKNEKVNWKNITFFFIVSLLFMVIFTPYLERTLYIVTNLFVYYLCTVIFFKKNFRSSLILLSVIISIMIFLPALIIMFLSVVFGEVGSNFTIGLIMQMLFLVVYFLFYKFAPLHVIRGYIEKNNRLLFALSLNIVIVGLLIVLYYNLNIKGFIELTIFFSVVTLLVLTINLIVIKNGLKNEHQEQMLRQYEEYMGVIYSLVEEIKQVQHEYDNHVQGIKLAMSFENGNDHNPKIADYMSDIDNKQWFRDLLKINNPMLMGLIMSKIKKAKDFNIGFEILDGFYDIVVPLKNYEQVELVGILLDNAIESCTVGGKVQLRLLQNGVMVRNTHENLAKDVINKMFNKGYSTKGTNRGSGLFTLEKLVKSYNGTIEVKNEKNGILNNIVISILF